jgi:hypothetical protein
VAHDLLPEGPAAREARRKLALLAVQYKEKLMRAGLVQTHRQMDRVTRMIGYEIAALEGGKWPITDLSFLEAP